MTDTELLRMLAAILLSVAERLAEREAQLETLGARAEVIESHQKEIARLTTLVKQLKKPRRARRSIA